MMSPLLGRLHDIMMSVCQIFCTIGQSLFTSLDRTDIAIRYMMSVLSKLHLFYFYPGSFCVLWSQSALSQSIRTQAELQ
jgi:hypothetical protein